MLRTCEFVCVNNRALFKSDLLFPVYKHGVNKLVKLTTVCISIEKNKTHWTLISYTGNGGTKKYKLIIQNPHVEFVLVLYNLIPTNSN